jgi:alpha-1,2-rhamnosyltransferase
MVFARADRNVYLVVGTIEPRKNHRRILDVFDRLWSEGSESSVLIVGRLGWLSDDVAKRIRTHREFGRRLFWLPAASDTELDHAYRHASALIFASCCEGFGLPLVEAMQYGLPVLASDIEVFREIGGEYPHYFDVDDERSLYEAVRGFESRAGSGERLQRQPQPWLSWAESARMLLEKVSVPGADASPRTADRLQTRA